LAALDRVKALLASLPREEQDNLYAYLQDLVGESVPMAASRHVAGIVDRAGVTVTYRQERVRCGKPGCKCARGELHGPYTYKYWREAGKLRKAYVPKKANGRG
jgi:hypothetical protein